MFTPPLPDNTARSRLSLICQGDSWFEIRSGSDRCRGNGRWCFDKFYFLIVRRSTCIVDARVVEDFVFRAAYSDDNLDKDWVTENEDVCKIAVLEE